MSDRMFSAQELRDRENLLKWMEAHGLSAKQLGDATGDATSAISMMTKGDRAVNEAFKWRFRRAFGDTEASSVFAETEPA